jgi:hypothetical protein
VVMSLFPRASYLFRSPKCHPLLDIMS